MSSKLAKTKPPKSVFRCQACSHAEPRWHGRCPSCAEWNSLVEELGAAAAPVRLTAPEGARPVALAEVDELEIARRLTSGIGELDRVLGAGLVPGALILLGGEPGIGKSTLLAQVLDGVARRADRPILYASGEESLAQVALRARRVAGGAAGVRLYSETSLERVLAAAEELRPAVLAVDSIQTVHTAELGSVPGSIGQVRECAARLMAFAKRTGIATIVVGHVTKDGGLAGPKTLEHMVDVVLSFEGDGQGTYRLLRALKNRFGSTDEVGVFEMRSSGLGEVANPSQLFLAERPVGVPGSVVVVSAEGSRPILCEVQGLVAAATAGFGRRTAAGVDGNRVALLLAVLAQRAALDVLDHDVFVNVAGGVRLGEPAVDLGVAAAIASSARGRAVEPGTVMFGEIGLAGEIRGVSLPELRLAEAKKLGFTRCILPRQNAERLAETIGGIELVPVDRLSTALAAL
jgi:DNA repair protein RadA/Sms